MIGMGMGVGFSSPPPWTPAAVPGCILYGGAYLEARATRAAQPVLYTAAADYTPSDPAVTLADDADIPAGLTGTSIKMTVSDAAPRWGNRNGVFIAGNRYAGEWWGKSDGADIIRMTSGSATNVFGQSTSAAWTLVTGEETIVSASMLLYRVESPAGVYYFKPLSLRNLSLTSYTPAYTTIPGSVLAQATATTQPWVSSDGLGIRYKGGDYLQWSAALSNLRCLHDGSGGTIIVAVRPSVLNDANYFVKTLNTVIDAANVGMCLYYTNANALGIRVMNGSGVAAIDTTVACSVAINTAYVFALRVAAGVGGVQAFRNGASVYTGTLAAPSAADPSFGLVFGAPSGGSPNSLDGILGHPAVYNRALTDAEILQISNYILAQATL